jgi:hypothetical protein
MLINPSRRPSKRRHIAMAKRRRKRRHVVRARSSNPVRRHRVHRRHRARRANPFLFKRKRRRSRGMVAHRRRRNPLGGRFTLRGFTTQTLVPSTIGAVGALGVDMALNLLPVPVAMKTGIMAPVTRIAGAVAIGALVGMMSNRRIGEQAAAGAITVVLYDTIKGMIGAKVPGLHGLYGDYPTMEYVSPAATVDADLGAYLPAGGESVATMPGEGAFGWGSELGEYMS